MSGEVSQKMKISKFLLNNASFEVNLALKDNSVIKNGVFKIPFMIKENKWVGGLGDLFWVHALPTLKTFN